MWLANRGHQQTRPERYTRGLYLAAGINNFLLHFLLQDNVLASQVPDLDAGARGNAETVLVRTEAQGIDDIPTIQHIKVFAFIEIPQHGLAILVSRSTEGQSQSSDS